MEGLVAVEGLVGCPMQVAELLFLTARLVKSSASTSCAEYSETNQRQRQLPAQTAQLTSGLHSVDALLLKGSCRARLICACEMLAFRSFSQSFSNEACNKAADGAEGSSVDRLAGRLCNLHVGVLQHEAVASSPSH